MAWKGRAVTLVWELGGGRVRDGLGGGIGNGGVGGGGFAYKPDWVELDVFLRSSRTVESSGICAFCKFMRCEHRGSDVPVLRSRRRNRFQLLV